MKKIRFLPVLLILCILFLPSCSISLTTNSSSPYNEQGELNKTFETHNKKSLTINSTLSNLTIVKKPINNINLKCKKTVGGKNEAKVKEAFEKIDYSIKYINNGLIINSSSIQNSKNEITNWNITTDVEIPDYIEEIKIINTVGNTTLKDSYKSVNIASDVGNVHFSGHSDKINISSNVGNVDFTGSGKNVDICCDVGNMNCKLQNIDKSNVYTFQSHVGNADILIPKQSNIFLDNSNSKIKIDEDLIQSSSGAKFIIKSSSTGHIKIKSY